MRVFISAVTSEFVAAREAIRSDLSARHVEVSVQSDFTHGDAGDTLLRRLHDYIRECSAAICVVGRHPGSNPPPAAAEAFAHMLPAGITEASYTQWEFFFARFYRRRLHTYIAANARDPDAPASDAEFPPLQRAFIRHIQAQGVHWTSFATVADLQIAVLREDWQPAPLAAKPEPTKPIVLPYPSLGALFKGRDAFIQRLRQSLTGARGGPTAIVNALYGLGGIGKTRAAVEYAWAHEADYTALLFVVGDTPEALRGNLAALSITLLPDLDTTDDAARLQAVLGWLNDHPGWLLIIDNLDGREAMAEAERLMARLTGGHLIITSRMSGFSAHIQPLELDVLTVEDATTFLLDRTEGRRRPAGDDAAKARELAVELGQLALALEIAAAYVSQRKTFGDYQEQWRQNRDAILAWFDRTVTGYERTVAVTWQTSVAQLTVPGRRLLERLAWLAPERVPEFLLDVPVPGTEAESLHDALADLASYSLVTRDAEGPFFLVHRLVQDVTRRSLADEARQRSLTEALAWIDAAFAGDPMDVRDWPKLEPLAPHVRAVTTHADTAGIPDPTSRLMNQLGVLLRSKASNAQAEPLYRRALAIDEASVGSDHPKVAIRLNNLAQLLQATNRHAEAEPLMRRALAIDEASGGPNLSKVAIRLNNLATLLQATNRLVEAEPLMRRALAIDEEHLGPDHPAVAIDLNNLATLLQDTNRLAEAEPLMRRALTIDEASFGPDHPNVSRHLNNLALLLQDTNRHAEAEPLMRRALAIDEVSFGPDHPSVATRLNNVALLLQDTDRLVEAEPLMRRALAIDEASFGPEHPRVANCLNNLAQLLQSTNRRAEAEPLMRRALAIDEASLGPDHPKVAIRLNNLARLLHDTDRLTEAEPLMRRHVAIFVSFTRATGHAHPHLEAALRNYARLLTAMGRSKAEIDPEIETLRRGEG